MLWFFSDWNSEAGHAIRLLGKVQSKQMVGADYFGRDHTWQSCEMNYFFNFKYLHLYIYSNR